VSFLSWLGIGLPIASFMLPACWWLLTCWLFPLPNEAVPAAEREVRSRLGVLGGLSRGEIATLCSFLFAVVLWIASPWLKPMALSIGAETYRPFAWLSDWRVGALAVALLMLWPVSLRPLTFALEMPDFKRVPWSVLVLFGGGLALSAAMTSSQADKMLAAGLEFFQTWPRPVAVLVFVVATIFFTEIASNTATTATALPILGALAESWGIHPAFLAIPVTIAASCAFMLPVGTPPNAIVFASGKVSGRDMIRAGWWLNWIAVAVITLISNQVVEWFLL
jgi:sodium-dependent dicarboxylate transporter 2/3/5